MAKQKDEDVRLESELLLCIGAPVMVLHNLCISHGLLNGTKGTIYDILYHPDTKEAAAILILVPKRVGNKDGYSGPSFLTQEEVRDGVNLQEFAVVALGEYTVEEVEGHVRSSRTQFPIMLSWAVTVHKAQGLTLPQVVFNAGDDEMNAGVFFVGLTRVRHPNHLKFHPMPTKHRVV